MPQARASTDALGGEMPRAIPTRDLDRAIRFSRPVAAGHVPITNSRDPGLGAPFGGEKRSGIGRKECLAEMLADTEAKTVTIVTGP